ncbi:MAG: efflux RND transporter periplasmic adaptor subunit [Steroidobacteraceae bacterium]
MNRRLPLIVLVTAIAAAAIGYLAGHRAAPGSAAATVSVVAPAAGSAGAEPRRVLYYRHPMGLKDTSPVPKKDEMGMAYIPVYADEEPGAARSVTLSPEKIQTLGVRTELVTRRMLERTLLAVGTVAVAEPRQRTIAPRFEGWVEQLHIDATGLAVRRGAPLVTVYSPQVVTAEEEYLIALESERALAAGAAATSGSTPAVPGASPLARAALTRLRNWGVPEGAITRLERERVVAHSLTLVLPIDGTVLEKNAVAGMRFMAGEVLYRLADLSMVWVIAEVHEQDLPWLRLGQAAQFETAAHPGERFTGHVGFIAPTVGAATRTVSVRVEFENAFGKLKPGMFGRLTLAIAGSDAPRLVVPKSAVIDSGTRKVVLLAREGGRFEPRDVRVGLSGAEFIEVTTGLTEGERVVTSANFLIDAESNLRAALNGMSPQGPGAAGEARGPASTGESESVDEHEHHEP